MKASWVIEIFTPINVILKIHEGEFISGRLVCKLLKAVSNILPHGAYD